MSSKALLPILASLLERKAYIRVEQVTQRGGM